MRPNPNPAPPSPNPAPPNPTLTRFDNLVEILTVEQMLMYTAELKLPALTRAQQLERCEEVISQLRLEECRKTVIGGELVKGISGGQKKCAVVRPAASVARDSAPRRPRHGRRRVNIGLSLQACQHRPLAHHAAARPLPR